MISLLWLDRFPNENVEEGVKVLDNVFWHIKIIESPGIFNVFAGEALIFRTDSKDAFEAFLYGLSLTYVSIDPLIVERFREELKKWI